MYKPWPHVRCRALSDFQSEIQLLRADATVRHSEVAKDIATLNKSQHATLVEIVTSQERLAADLKAVRHDVVKLRFEREAELAGINTVIKTQLQDLKVQIAERLAQELQQKFASFEARFEQLSFQLGQGRCDPDRESVKKVKCSQCWTEVCETKGGLCPAEKHFTCDECFTEWVRSKCVPADGHVPYAVVTCGVSSSLVQDPASASLTDPSPHRYSCFTSRFLC